MGIIRASARLLGMGGVTVAGVIAALFAGVGLTTAVAIGIVLAGVVGLVEVARRPRVPSNHEEIAAMIAPLPPTRVDASVIPTRATAVDTMAPRAGVEVDAEANMPRWRRPSLLEARRSDPRRQAPSYRLPMRFHDDEARPLDVRVVRYAVVPLLDRPDEVLGLRLSDLESGDEVHVAAASGTFVEVQSPNGERGWVHRTTLGPRPTAAPFVAQSTPSEADDALSALLAARGLA